MVDIAKDKGKPKKTAYEESVRYLGMRMRTVRETRSHLREKGYESDEIERVISELKDGHYLDDEHYVMVYAEYAFGKGRGSRRIFAELKEKGIDTEIIGNAIEDYKYENGIDERALAYSVARRVAELDLDGKDRCFDDRLGAKVARRLDSLGFETGMIYGILGELRNEFGGEDD